MIQGLYAAANGMLTAEDRQAVVANNIANVSTPGFKRQFAVQKGYYAAYFENERGPHRLNMEEAPGGGVKLIETFTDFSNGIITTTGRALDLALVGPGFMTVDTPNGVRYTRSGQFAVGPEGALMTPHGYAVMSTDGETINVDGADIQINRNGVVVVDGENRGQIEVVEFEDPHMLVRAGYSLYFADEAALERSGPAALTVVNSGAIERSNVDLPTEILNMMLALRAYAANQNVIHAMDETVSRMIDQVGMPT